MIVWALIFGCTMFVYGLGGVYPSASAQRGRGGLLPGHDPLPAAYRSRPASTPRAVDLFMSTITNSCAISTPISGGVMGAFDGVAGLEGLTMTLPTWRAMPPSLAPAW